MTDVRPDRGDVDAAARRFRAALDRHARALGLEGLLEFPRGACGTACELLGQYLSDCGLGEWTYVSRVDAGGHTHAWLARDGVVVDITGDQFGWSPVIVVDGPAVEHARFDTRLPGDGHVANLGWFDGAIDDSAGVAAAAYRQLRAAAGATGAGAD